MEAVISKIDNFYKLKEKYGCYIFLEPIPDELKIITLIITKELPKEIRKEILDKLIIEIIKEKYIYEKIIKEYEDEEINLYYKEKVYLIFRENYESDKESYESD